MNDAIESVVDGATSDKIVARHIVLLSDTVGTVFALAAIRISPGELNESHIGRSRESKSDTSRLDGADDKFGTSLLEGIDGSLLACGRVATSDTHGSRESLLQTVNNLVIGAEDYERFAVVEEDTYKVDSLCHLDRKSVV